jgi:hypothetical protein
MMKLSSMLVAVALGGCFATVDDQGRMMGGEATFTVGLPTVLPPLIVVQPGVSVVSDVDEEVFYSGGYYWARRDGTWIRATDHRGRWSRVEERRVPAPILQSPPGRYRHYRGEERQRGDEGRGRQEGHDRRDDR